MIDWMALEDWEVTTISQIAVRACQLAPGMGWRKMDLEMDLSAAHLASRLHLEKLRDFEPGDLLHDVSGIVANIDRTNGQLRNCFLPRCAAPDPAEETVNSDHFLTADCENCRVADSCDLDFDDVHKCLFWLERSKE